jgi:hypothetical protein
VLTDEFSKEKEIIQRYLSLQGNLVEVVDVVPFQMLIFFQVVALKCFHPLITHEGILKQIIIQ